MFKREQFGQLVSVLHHPFSERVEPFTALLMGCGFPACKRALRTGDRLVEFRLAGIGRVPDHFTVRGVDDVEHAFSGGRLTIDRHMRGRGPGAWGTPVRAFLLLSDAARAKFGRLVEINSFRGGCVGCKGIAERAGVGSLGCCQPAAISFLAIHSAISGSESFRKVGRIQSEAKPIIFRRSLPLSHLMPCVRLSDESGTAHSDL